MLHENDLWLKAAKEEAGTQVGANTKWMKLKGNFDEELNRRGITRKAFIGWAAIMMAMIVLIVITHLMSPNPTQLATSKTECIALTN